MITSDEVIESLRAGMDAAADPQRAPAMIAYLKDKFPMLGIGATERRNVQKPTLQWTRQASIEDAYEIVDWCYEQPEREFHYVACDIVRQRAKSTPAEYVEHLELLISTHSWWDTVDTLAVNGIGPILARHPDLHDLADCWIEDDDFWIARTAILFQLKYRENTDASRLFRYCEQRQHDKEFFIRKAIGWALRQYARTDADAVVAFVNGHPDLSGLSRREALKHLD